MVEYLIHSNLLQRVVGLNSSSDLSLKVCDFVCSFCTSSQGEISSDEVQLRWEQGTWCNCLINQPIWWAILAEQTRKKHVLVALNMSCNCNPVKQTLYWSLLPLMLSVSIWTSPDLFAGLPLGPKSFVTLGHIHGRELRIWFYWDYYYYDLNFSRITKRLGKRLPVMTRQMTKTVTKRCKRIHVQMSRLTPPCVAKTLVIKPPH